MMNDEKLAVLMESVGKMKAKGVTGIKLELEAQLDRRYRGSDHNDNLCDECDEDNQVRCINSNSDDRNPWGECNGCDECSDGWAECPECHGTGVLGDAIVTDDNRNWGRESICFEWLMNKLAEKTGESYTGGQTYEMTNPLSWVKFAKFYNDGSVDSELTITVPIANEENVKNIPKILEAFKEMADAMGSTIDVRGAGMHTAVIFSEDCTYPSDNDDYTQLELSDSRRLPERQLLNFKKSMTQLLPALFFLASSNENSRALRYRVPQVSVNYRQDAYNNARYSAVTYRQGAFEFRVFDTCYQEPLMILDNIVVIANCLEYLSDTYKNPGLDRLAPRLQFGTDQNDRLDRFYMTTTHIDVLNNGLKKIKPSYYTLRDVKRMRKFNRTKPSLVKLQKEQERKAELAYEEYAERRKWSISSYEHNILADEMDNFIRRLSASELREMTVEKVREAVKDRVEQRLERYRQNTTDKTSYIQNLMRDYRESTHGQYTLRFN